MTTPLPLPPVPSSPMPTSSSRSCLESFGLVQKNWQEAGISSVQCQRTKIVPSCFSTPNTLLSLSTIAERFMKSQLMTQQLVILPVDFFILSLVNSVAIGLTPWGILGITWVAKSIVWEVGHLQQTAVFCRSTQCLAWSPFPTSPLFWSIKTPAFIGVPAAGLKMAQVGLFVCLLHFSPVWIFFFCSCLFNLFFWSGVPKSERALTPMKIVQAPRAPGNCFVDLLFFHHVVVYNIEMIVNFVCCF